MKVSENSIQDILGMIQAGEDRIECTGLEGSERAYLLAQIYSRLNRPFFVLTPTSKEAEELISDIRFFSGDKNIPLLYFPRYDIPPFRGMPYHPETASIRIKTLYRMMTDTLPVFVVAPVAALLQKIIPKEALSGFVELLMVGEEVDRDSLIEKLISGGYCQAPMVEQQGDLSVRGGILDIFPPLYQDPIRIEFFGETIESLRTFSVANQRSFASLREVVLLPANEVILPPSELDTVTKRIHNQARLQEIATAKVAELIEQLKEREQLPGVADFLSLIYPRLDTLFDYISSKSLMAMLDYPVLEKVALETEERLTRSYFTARSEGRLCVEPKDLYMKWDEAKDKIREKGTILVVKALPVGGNLRTSWHANVKKNEAIIQKIKACKKQDEPLRPLIDWTNELTSSNISVFMICATKNQAQRLKDILFSYHVSPEMSDTFSSQYKTRRGLCICLGRVSSGFVWPGESLAVITEDEIFGAKHRIRGRARPKQIRYPKLALEDLKKGDLVVHMEHGIGLYCGLVKLEVDHRTNDFLLIEYRDGDKLYLPVDKMNCIQKYIGVEGISPRLDKMGGKTWERVKDRVKKSAQKMAKQLLRLYAWRKVQKGHAFSRNDSYLRDFEAAFEYNETPDQIKAIEEVMADMESDSPMDRLVCGDVGYGKTEVALRASFKAVLDNKQVAFLVPTTVLVEQHMRTFSRRFEGYPVEIAALNRFRSQKEQRSIIDGLKDGRIDIVIGTHRLLQKDVTFKDLGLIIIDEEHRFGVAHKEKLKQLRRLADVLTLSATPIPRTLHMSLMGVRDISIINTPPEHRYPIETYISPFDDSLIIDAIHRELARGGQIFFVHNHIQSIWKMARYIQKLVPEVRIGVVHGQLDEAELERVMLKFLDREIDLLVCTSIIESGLDIPSANTILINRADRFGLAQIYQLRGRVGRSNEKAYAYLFIPEESQLTKEAQKRLKALMEYSDTGSGFQIAMSDLQIRGAGTILGVSQSGHIASVGYEMFIDLMEKAISELKGEPVEKELDPEISVDVSAYIPEDYITHIDQRLGAYKRLAKMDELSDLDIFVDELKDRFGPLPVEARCLIDKISLKILSRKAGVERLDISNGKIVITFHEKKVSDPRKIIDMIQQDPDRFRFTPDGILTLNAPSDNLEYNINSAKKILSELCR
nr:transcription-repair coupling factor [Desulfobacterales bacterium]